jgi:glycine/D-amino acid oxidase-like deaminating enzyme
MSAVAPHVVVIGAGVIGASIAFRLAERGARVTVIDAQGTAAGASGRSFGWINASFFVNDAHFALRRNAIAAHRRLDADLATGSGVRWTGTLWWEEEGAGFDAMRDRLAALGYALGDVTGTEVRAQCPALGAVPDRALSFPDEGWVDAGDLTRRLLAAARAWGARVWTGVSVREILSRAGHVTGVATPDGALDGDAVVVAAGNGAPAVLAPLGVPLPMLPRPGLLLRTRPVAPVLDRILVTPLMELRQEPDGRLLAPASAGHQGDKAEALADRPDRLADDALARLRALFPRLDLEWEEITVAHRPVPGDGLPVVGAAGPEGLYVAVMHSGVTLAALVGEVAAAEVLGGAADAQIEGFRPGRFAGDGPAVPG